MTRLTAAVLVALLGVTLAGCAPKPDVSDQVAQKLQESVQLVASSAAAGDPSAAMAELDALQASVAAAVKSGDVTESRSDDIETAIDLVRADLAQEIADAAEKAAADQAAADQAELDRVAEEQAAKDAEKPGKGQKPDKKP